MRKPSSYGLFDVLEHDGNFYYMDTDSANGIWKTRILPCDKNGMVKTLIPIYSREYPGPLEAFDGHREIKEKIERNI